MDRIPNKLLFIWPCEKEKASSSSVSHHAGGWIFFPVRVIFKYNYLFSLEQQCVSFLFLISHAVYLHWHREKTGGLIGDGPPAKDCSGAEQLIAWRRPDCFSFVFSYYIAATVKQQLLNPLTYMKSPWKETKLSDQSRLIFPKFTLLVNK